MPHPPVGVFKEAEIAEAVAEVERLTAPDVVHIRFEVTQDWNDDWAAYFRILLSDEAADRRPHETKKKVKALLDERLNFPLLGLYRYHHVRSASEQAKLREEIWA